jgi:starvation-inducible DNA-binding protein
MPKPKPNHIRPLPAAGNGRPPGLHPLPRQHGAEVQRFGEIRLNPIAMSHGTTAESSELLNQILADTIILYSLYKKHHWHMRGATFYQLHLLLDKHAGEQLALVDSLAERVQTLGAVAVADPRHVAELTTVPRPPDGIESVPDMLHRLLEAHEIVIEKVREAVAKTAANRDDGTNDLLVSDVLRTNELQVWFIAEHLVDVPVVWL